MQPDRSPLAQALIDLYQSHRLDQFVKACEEAKKDGVDLAELQKKEGIPFDLPYQYQAMKYVVEETDKSLGVAKSANDGWKEMPVNKEVRMWLRCRGTIVELKVTGSLKCDAANLLTMAYLFKLFKECLPFCKSSEEVAKVSTLQKVGFICMSMPIPIVKDRCVFVRQVMIDRIDVNNSITLYLEGVNDKQEYLDKYEISLQPRMKNSEVFDVRQCTIELSCNGKEEAFFSAHCLCDHHMRFLPERLILFVAKELSKYLLNKLFGLICDWGGPWKEDRQTHFEDSKEFYEWLDTRVATWQEQTAQKKEQK